MSNLYPEPGFTGTSLVTVKHEIDYEKTYTKKYLWISECDLCRWQSTHKEHDAAINDAINHTRSYRHRFNYSKWAFIENIYTPLMNCINQLQDDASTYSNTFIGDAMKTILDAYVDTHIYTPRQRP